MTRRMPWPRNRFEVPLFSPTPSCAAERAWLMHGKRPTAPSVGDRGRPRRRNPETALASANPNRPPPEHRPDLGAPDSGVNYFPGEIGCAAFPKAHRELQLELISNAAFDFG